MATIRIAALALLLCAGTAAQGSAQPASEASRAVTGGITVPGWTGKIDAREEQAGRSLADARLSGTAAKLEVTTGPAVTYWNPANTASGTYTVKAAFTEANYMGLNEHPHPYGIVIAGSDMGMAGQSYLYCAAYGNGNFIVRGFGPEPFHMGAQRPEAHAAVQKAAGKGSSVTQEIAMSVKADRVECAINGTTVGSYPRTEVVTAGRLKSTDGIYGVRFGHNTSAVVAGLTMTKD
jgi:hypothetical protein